MQSRKTVLDSWEEYHSVLNAMVSSVSSLPGAGVGHQGGWGGPAALKVGPTGRCGGGIKFP